MRALIFDSHAERVEKLVSELKAVKILSGFDVVPDPRDLKSYLEYTSYPVAFVSGDLLEKFTKVASSSNMNSDALAVEWRGDISSIFKAVAKKHGFLEEPVLSIAGMKIDPMDRKACKVGDVSVQFAPMEHRLLYSLALNNGRLVPYSEIETSIWGEEGLEGVSNLRKRMAGQKIKLRSKIKDAGGDPDIIQVRQGRGMIFLDPKKKNKIIEQKGKLRVLSDDSVYYGDKLVDVEPSSTKILLALLKANGRVLSHNYLKDKVLSGRSGETC